MARARCRGQRRRRRARMAPSTLPRRISSTRTIRTARPSGRSCRIRARSPAWVYPWARMETFTPSARRVWACFRSRRRARCAGRIPSFTSGRLLITAKSFSVRTAATSNFTSTRTTTFGLCGSTEPQSLRFTAGASPRLPRTAPCISHSRPFHPTATCFGPSRHHTRPMFSRRPILGATAPTTSGRT